MFSLPPLYLWSLFFLTNIQTFLYTFLSPASHSLCLRSHTSSLRRRLVSSNIQLASKGRGPCNFYELWHFRQDRDPSADPEGLLHRGVWGISDTITQHAVRILSPGSCSLHLKDIKTSVRIVHGYVCFWSDRNLTFFCFVIKKTILSWHV